MFRPLSAITLFVLSAQLLGPALAGDKLSENLGQHGLEAMRSELRQNTLRDEQALFEASVEAMHLEQLRALVTAQDKAVDQRTAGVSNETAGNKALLRLELPRAPSTGRVAKEFDMPYFSFGRGLTPSRSPQP